MRPCGSCGREPAAGLASVWTRATGEVWYCHGDEDESPTCYERVPPSGFIDEILSALPPAALCWCPRGPADHDADGRCSTRKYWLDVEDSEL